MQARAWLMQLFAIGANAWQELNYVLLFPSEDAAACDFLYLSFSFRVWGFI